MSIPNLTAALRNEFEQLGGDEASEALSSFAEALGGDDISDFGLLLSPLEAVGAALPHLRALAGIADKFKDRPQQILSEASELLLAMHRVGLATTLQLISERAKGQGEDVFDSVIVETCKAIVELNSADTITVGTPNYDGLLHAGFLSIDGLRFSDLAAGYSRTTASPDGVNSLSGLALRHWDDLRGNEIDLLNVHGSLAWLADLNTSSAIKFELDELRAIDYWHSLGSGTAVLLPQVVLTDQKQGIVREWPFSLAYQVLERRLTLANRWLIAGYAFRDRPLNDVMRRAVEARAAWDWQPPTILVVDKGRQLEDCIADMISATGVPSNRVNVDLAGFPDAIGGDPWNVWST
jgi:hypothetical protein